MQSAATGVKDDLFAVQSPNPLPILAAVTRALQEAMGHIETLTSRVELLEGQLASRAMR